MGRKISTTRGEEQNLFIVKTVFKVGGSNSRRCLALIGALLPMACFHDDRERFKIQKRDQSPYDNPSGGERLTED